MYRFVVVTDPDSAPGFRLAGVDVLEVSNLDEAKKIIPPLIYKDDTGIVAISEDFMAALDEKLLEKIKYFIAGNKGTVNLKVLLVDPSENVSVVMFSRSKHVALSDAFLEVLMQNPGIEFRLV